MIILKLKFKGGIIMEKKFLLNGLDCANCANKIEDRINKLESIKEATVNFSTATLILEIKDGYEKEDIINEVKNIIKKLEPGVKVTEKIGKVVANRNIKKCESAKCSISDHKHEHSSDDSGCLDKGHNHTKKTNVNNVEVIMNCTMKISIKKNMVTTIHMMDKVLK